MFQNGIIKHQNKKKYVQTVASSHKNENTVGKKNLSQLSIKCHSCK